MADRSQHPLQIMENKTRFDLNAAVESWQQELAAQPELTPDVRRELETHLRDTVTELQQRGLSEEESFWLARRRAGQPKQLGEEFGKTDPGNRWHKRAFGILIVLFGIYLWLMLISFSQLWMSVSLFQKVTFQDVLPSWALLCSPHWLRGIPTVTFFRLLFYLTLVMPVVAFAAIIAIPPSKRFLVIYQFLLKSRGRFALMSLFAFMTINSLNILFLHGFALERLVANCFIALPLILLATWFMPTHKTLVVSNA